MDREQWKEIEQRLSHPYGRVTVRADGHTLNLVVERGKGLRYLVAVYIDGKIEWKHTVSGEDGPHRKFWRCRTRHAWPAAKRAELAKLAKKRGIPAASRKVYADAATSSFDMYDPTFPNAAALCRHLRKTCTSVELVADGVPA